MKKLQENELELQTINNDIQAKMQTISTVLDDIQSDMAKMRVDIDSGLAQHTVITEIKEEINEVKSQSFVDIAPLLSKKWKKMEGEVNVVKQTITETRENAEEERDKEARRNNIIIYRMKESAAASAELRRQDDFDTLVALLDKVFEVSYNDGDIKRVIRLGKKEEGTDRPILVEFQSRILKNYIMANLKKLGSADRKFKCLSVTHDITKKEREQCKFWWSLQN